MTTGQRQLELLGLDLPDELRQDPAFLCTGESRNGCRVPTPWSGELAPYGFAPTGSERSWLPAPATWRALSVTAQTGVAGSTLELYRAAPRIRHEHPALAVEADGLTWLDSGPGVLAFSRTSGATVLTCVVNLSGAPVLIDGYAEPLVESEALTGQGSGHLLPVDAAAWLERR